MNTAKDERKYLKLKRDIEALAYRIEQQFCTCGPEYTGRGMIAPNCQAHDIREFIIEWVEQR